MKLKTKLIATIVSICAAVAVMGVGIWAATQTYSVAVTNHVDMTFANLTGTVKVKAGAKGFEFQSKGSPLTTGTAQTLDETTIFDSSTGGAKYTSISSGDTVGGANLQFLGADAFLSTSANNVLSNQATSGGNNYAVATSAVLWYEFTYTPLAGAEENGVVGFQIDSEFTDIDRDDASALTASGVASGISIRAKYYMAVSGSTELVEMTAVHNSTSYYVAKSNASVTIYCALIYTNASNLSIKLPQTNWNFELKMNTSITSFADASATLKLNATTANITFENTTPTVAYTFPATTTNGNATNVKTLTIAE